MLITWAVCCFLIGYFLNSQDHPPLRDHVGLGHRVFSPNRVTRTLRDPDCSLVLHIKRSFLLRTFSLSHLRHNMDVFCSITGLPLLFLLGIRPWIFWRNPNGWAASHDDLTHPCDACGKLLRKRFHHHRPSAPLSTHWLCRILSIPGTLSMEGLATRELLPIAVFNSGFLIILLSIVT